MQVSWWQGNYNHICCSNCTFISTKPWRS